MVAHRVPVFVEFDELIITFIQVQGVCADGVRIGGRPEITTTVVHLW